ncbi:MAG: DUF3823 domain-containing protein [Tannerella sp.]|jgi:hypothetical protein|nr:DUF3823 domain-containing protein [Tannerella sp.]
MKKILFYIAIISVMMFYSCELFELDNYDAPQETLKGTITDIATGEPVLTDQGSEGIRVRIRELSWLQTATPDNFDILCRKDGTYQNTKIFKGHYNVRIDGPFIPLVRMTIVGDTLVDESKYVGIKGVTEVNFHVQPFLKLEWVGQPIVANGKITASFRVTRAVTPEDFQAKIQPLGGYNDNFLEVSDVRLFVSQVQYVGLHDRDDRYSVQVNYTGNAFNSLFGQTITLTTNSEILSGRIVWIRAAARIRYLTENISRYNYNEEVKVIIP